MTCDTKEANQYKRELQNEEDVKADPPLSKAA